MVNRVEWGPQYQIGINVIDAQHHRIVDYINMLADMDENVSQSKEMKNLLELLVDYTYSHFAFEEALMEEAGYEFLADHQQTHKVFKERVEYLHQIFETGEDVGREIGEMLQNWLIHHIQDDDQSYASVVKDKLNQIEDKYPGGWVTSAIKHFFK